jgi:uncharacterized protein (DUF2237 family)
MLRDDRSEGERRPGTARNVLGEPLELCSIKPITGFYRDGCCNTGEEDFGSHTVCAVMTAACLCAQRWQEALEANRAPRVVLRATHEGALAYCALADLKRLAIDLA